MSAQCGRRHWITGLVKAQSRTSSPWQSVVASRCSPAFSATFWLERLSGRTRATNVSVGISSEALDTTVEAASVAQPRPQRCAGLRGSRTLPPSRSPCAGSTAAAWPSSPGHSPLGTHRWMVPRRSRGRRALNSSAQALRPAARQRAGASEVSRSCPLPPRLARGERGSAATRSTSSMSTRGLDVSVPRASTRRGRIGGGRWSAQLSGGVPASAWRSGSVVLNEGSSCDASALGRR